MFEARRLLDLPSMPEHAVWRTVINGLNETDNIKCLIMRWNKNVNDKILRYFETKTSVNDRLLGYFCDVKNRIYNSL